MRLLSLVLVLWAVASAVNGMVLLTFHKSHDTEPELCYWKTNIFGCCTFVGLCDGNEFERRSSGYYPTIYEDVGIIKHGWAKLWHFKSDYGKDSCYIGGKKFCCSKLSNFNMDELKEPIKVHFHVHKRVDGVTRTTMGHLPKWARQHNVRVAGEEFPAPLQDDHDDDPSYKFVH